MIAGQNHPISSKNGFTLIEIMISMAILAILATIGMSNYVNYRSKSYCTAVENDAHAIIATLIDYFAIPAHNELILPVDLTPANSYSANGITYPVLSNQNTARLEGNVDDITIHVTDVSSRCPNNYQQAIMEWSGGVYTKNFR